MRAKDEVEQVLNEAQGMAEEATGEVEDAQERIDELKLMLDHAREAAEKAESAVESAWRMMETARDGEWEHEQRRDLVCAFRDWTRGILGWDELAQLFNDEHKELFGW